MTDPKRSTVLITGGARGLGRQLAAQMLRRGATVILWDLDEEGLTRCAEELSLEGGRVFTYVCDVGKREQVEQVAARVLEQHLRVDVLVNNAGVVSGRTFLELAPETIETTMRVNVLSLFWMTRAFLPGMIERNHGHVVTIASAAGLIGVSKLADYSASKFAAFGFDESLRVELRERAPGVKTTVVCPYFIDTGMFEGVRTRFSWLLPILEEGRVAARIVRAIERDEARLFMPPLVYTVPLMRALPVKLFDKVASVLGVNVSMKDFVGRRRR